MTEAWKRSCAESNAKLERNRWESQRLGTPEAWNASDVEFYRHGIIVRDFNVSGDGGTGIRLTHVESRDSIEVRGNYHSESSCREMSEAINAFVAKCENR